MKKKSLNSKLSLNKKRIAILSGDQGAGIIGAGTNATNLTVCQQNTCMTCASDCHCDLTQAACNASMNCGVSAAGNCNSGYCGSVTCGASETFQAISCRITKVTN